MSIFGKLLKTALDVATSPIAVIKDVATLGGTLTDQHKSYTSQKINQVENDFEEVIDEIYKL